MTAEARLDRAARHAWHTLLAQGIGGIGPLSSARDLAGEYLDSSRYAEHDARVGALIRAETTKNFTTGFLTGLGGAITLPVAVPTALCASWLLQARMSGAIAHVYGHDLESARTRTAILLSLAGDLAKEAIDHLGLPRGMGLTWRVMDRVPGRALVEIQKRVGSQLLVRATERSAARFARFLPLAGGIVGGALDATVCHQVGQAARALFWRAEGALLEGEVLRIGADGATRAA